MKSLILAVSLAVTSVAANASNWVQYGSNDTGNQMFYDTQSVTHLNSDVLTLWIWTTFPYDNINIIKGHEVINCRNLTLDSDYLISYHNTNIINQGSTPLNMHPAVPDSSFETLLQIVCK